MHLMAVAEASQAVARELSDVNYWPSWLHWFVVPDG
jgi:hypothetical protein